MSELRFRPQSPDNQSKVILSSAYVRAKNRTFSGKRWDGEYFSDELVKAIAFFKTRDEMTPAGIDSAKESGEKIAEHLEKVTVAPLSELDAPNGEVVGGQYNPVNKEITLSQKLVAEAVFSGGSHIDALKAVKKHEVYHAENHNGVLRGGREKNGQIVFTIGGEDFTQNELFEAINTIDTGDSLPTEFESKEYALLASKLLRAIKQTQLGLTLEEVRMAINVKKDLTSITDFPEELDL